MISLIKPAIPLPNGCRFPTLCLGIFGLACGSADVTEIAAPSAEEDSLEWMEATAPGAVATDANHQGGHYHEFVPEPELVFGRLDVRDENLILSLENLTDVAGTVSLTAIVDNPEGLYYTEVPGTAALGQGESVELVLSPSDLAGLDLATFEWTDARIVYQVQLADSRQSGTEVSVFVEDGRAVPPHPVTSSGRAYGFPEMDDSQSRADRLVEKQVGSFDICFDHVVTYDGVTEAGIDFFKAPTQRAFAYGLMVAATNPNGVLVSKDLDDVGCATFTRVVGNWSFRATLASVHWPIPNVTIQGRRDAPFQPIPTKTVSVAITQGTPAVQVLSFAAGPDAKLQAGLVTTQQVVRRGMALGTIVLEHEALTIQMHPEETDYHHPSRTIRVTTASAARRSGMAHEVGHWIQSLFSPPNDSLNNDRLGIDYTYCKAGDACTVPPNDGCGRGTGHNIKTIEWESVAHREGFANFMMALAYNRAQRGDDCTLPDFTAAAPASLRTCEGLGLYLKSGATGGGNCFEWTQPIFTSVGNEWDWTKLYWDLFADEQVTPTALRSYLIAEGLQTTGWTRTNHVEQILGTLSGSPAFEAAFRRSATGNIWDGIAH